MKLIIDIPDKDYEKLKDGHIPFSLLSVIENGVPLDNMTNGEVIDALFGNSYSAKKTWWDTPYKVKK